MFTDRLIMCSSKLEELFPSIYEDFFHRNTLVSSGSFYVPWGPIAMVRSGNIPFLKSPTELRLYVGVTPTKTGKIEFGSLNHFDPVAGKFHQKPLRNYHREMSAISDLLNTVLKTSGLHIEVLSEHSRGHVFGFSGTFSSTLCDALFRVGVIETPTESFELAKKLGSIAKYGNSVGSNEAFTWHAPSGITVYVGDKQEKPFFEITKDASVFPLYMGVLFSGVESATHAVEAKKRTLEKGLSDLAYYVVSNPELHSFFPRVSDYSELFLNDRDGRLLIPIVRHMHLLEQLCTRHSIEAEEDFFENAQEISAHLRFVDGRSIFSEKVQEYFSRETVEGDILTIMPIYSSSLGGSYIFFLRKTPSALRAFSRTMHALEAFYPEARLEYFSEDLSFNVNPERRLDQDIELGIFGRFKDHSKLTLSISGGEKMRLNRNDIAEKFSEGILIDVFLKKVSINGNQLTSKEHPSQILLVNLLKQVLESPTHEVSSRDLGASSYTRNKNDMVSKILAPFAKIVEKATGRPIKFTCKGTVSDYFIHLETNNVPFAMAEM